jgi:hypothetical protein
MKEVTLNSDSAGHLHFISLTDLVLAGLKVADCSHS